jgi:uncharacterized membrane protein YdfJ with MMPL/SSD domain
MALVFAGFATGSLLLVQQLGFAVAAAVVVDATLVRCLLLPATVSLMARRTHHSVDVTRGRTGDPQPVLLTIEPTPSTVR